MLIDQLCKRRRNRLTITKPFNIPKKLVFLAYQKVKANAGGAGVDKQSLQDFDKNLENNLYTLWNKLSSGSYFPPPVRIVPIPKKTGGERRLGIPTVGDRIAQMVAKLVLEPDLEPIFDEDSYGYRPKRSALDAVAITQKRCWKRSWVLEFDIKGLFDEIDHILLMKAVEKHTKNKWILLYTRRWLNAELEEPDGTRKKRTKGVPQGGVISPLLANLFLHYAFDSWMRREHSNKEWCRYADDGLIHCQTKADADSLLRALIERFKECGLEVNSSKTQIVYCNGSRYDIKKYTNRDFVFLGYLFRDRWTKNPKTGELFLGFNPGVSKEALKSMRQQIRKMNIRNRADMSLNQLARKVNPIIRGWVQYYGRFNKSALRPLLRHINLTLISWAMRKYKTLRGKKTQAAHFIRSISEREPSLFAHWKAGMTGVFA